MLINGNKCRHCFAVNINQNSIHWLVNKTLYNYVEKYDSTKKICLFISYKMFFFNKWLNKNNGQHKAVTGRNQPLTELTDKLKELFSWMHNSRLPYKEADIYNKQKLDRLQLASSFCNWIHLWRRHLQNSFKKYTFCSFVKIIKLQSNTIMIQPTVQSCKAAPFFVFLPFKNTFHYCKDYIYCRV